MKRLGFSYTEARGLKTEEAELYLAAWDELNTPSAEKRTKVRRKKKP